MEKKIEQRPNPLRGKLDRDIGNYSGLGFGA